MVSEPKSSSLAGPHERQPRVGGLVVRGATVVTMNDAFDVIEGDVLIRDGRIVSIGATPDTADQVIDANGSYLLPGFIQTHIISARHSFEAMPRPGVLDAEDAHLADGGRANPRSLAAPPTGASELLRSGTTTVLTMETVHDTDAVFEALEPMGLRAGRRQVHDGLGHRCSSAVAREHSIRSTRRWRLQRWTAAQWRCARVCAAVCGVVLARAARRGGASCDRPSAPGSYARPENRDEVADKFAHRTEHQLCN